MTEHKKSILEQYSDLTKEKEETVRRIADIEAKLDRLNREGNVNDAVKGGLGNKQTYHIKGFPVGEEDELRCQLSKQKRILKERESIIRDKTNELELWLNGLNDSRMRRMIIKRFIEGKEWRQVAIEMGKSCTSDSCKKQMERFIKEFDKM